MEEKQTHRNQTNRQIILPVTIGFLVFAALVGILIYFSLRDPILGHKLGNSAIVLVLLTLILINIALLFFLFIVIGALGYAARQLPGYLDLANEKVAEAGTVIKDVLNKSAEPVIKTKSSAAGFRHFFSKLTARKGE